MLLLTVLIACASAIKSKNCSRSSPNNYEVSLHRKLLATYESYLTPPLKNPLDTLQVNIRILPQYFKLDVHEESFFFHMWLILTWKDEYLTWDPKDYGGIEETTIDYYRIWDPMMILDGYSRRSRLRSVRHTNPFYSTNSINSTGHVVFNTQFSEVVPCKANVRRWPYDTQVCTYTFGDLQKDWQRVNFWVHKMTNNVAFIDPGPGWRLININQSRTDFKYCCKNITNSAMHTVKLTFEMRREAAALTAVVIIPCVILAVLTVTSQVLEVKGYVRAGLLAFNIYIHLTLLKQVDAEMPRHGSEVPLVVTFLCSSLTVTCISLILVFLLKMMHNSVNSPPPWIVSKKDKIMLIFYFWSISKSSESTESKSSPDSVECAFLINVFCTLVFLVIYLSLIFTTLPMDF